MNGLRLGAFKDLFSKRPVKTIDEIQVRAKRYIYLKEIQRVTANLARSQVKKKPGPQQEDRQRKQPRVPRVGRYHDYTPLNVSLTRLYKEVRQVERFPKPKAL